MDLLLLVLLCCFSFQAGNVARGADVQIKEKYTTEALQDKVTDPLPGFTSNQIVPFDHYAGYVTVNKTAGRALFYWLVEAAENPSSKPLILWLNGGPGCSSIGYGGLLEIGPFHMNKSNVVLNPYAWNKDANVLFLDSPAGVGFSYSNTSSDYETPGDAKTARDSLVFLQRWLERFPTYKNREFYLTGESYAGNYVPQLAKLIYENNNKDGSSESAINLKGFMVGNALMDNEQDMRGSIDYWYTHSLISHKTHDSLMRSCILENVNQNECDVVMNQVTYEFGDIDIYNIYAETCHSYKSKRVAILREHVLRSTKFPGYDPCVEDYVSAYLNRPEVQRVLHANVSVWFTCSQTIGGNWQDRASSVLSIYKELIQAGLRIWVYSGDMDAVVPVTSSRYSIEKLNLTIVTPWFPWYRNEQVGGHSEVYQGLTYVTVRGAGHEVPMFQPGQALSLIQSFLAGKEMPQEPVAYRYLKTL